MKTVFSKTTFRIALTLMAALLFCVLSARCAFAVGTASGTVITSLPTIAADGATATATVSTTVKPVYGLATSVAMFTDPIDAAAGAGQYKDYVFRVTNSGNASTTVRINIGPQTFSPANAGAPLQWSVQVDDASPFAAGLTFTGSGATRAAQAGDYAQVAVPLTADTSASVTVRVWAAPDSLTGGWGAATVTFQTPDTPVGTYAGLNGTNYGGAVVVARSSGTGLGAAYITTTVSGAVLSLTKNVVSVVKPVAYTGGASDPVPGSSIEYELQFSNPGAVSAENSALNDTFPANTTFVPGSIMRCFSGGVGCVTAPDPDAQAGGDCYLVTGGLRCDIGSIAPGGGGRLRYKVTIN